jgi:hypothetical protein
MQPLNAACPCLEPVVPIAYEKHATIEELEVRIRSQLGLKFSINCGLVKAPATCILILYRPLLTMLVADGNIKHGCSRALPMCELSLQPLNVICKSWTD